MPCPYGFSFGFLKYYWNLIKDNVIAFVMHFFSHSSIPKGCNSSFFIFIPKVRDPKIVRDFRPISLISCQYKINGKHLANRLAYVIGSIVSLEQSSFIKGIHILDDSFLLNEVVAWFKASKNPLLVFKGEFEKFYDSISWEYLHEIMLIMGFGSKWCDWIMEMLRSTRASVLVNWSLT